MHTMSQPDPIGKYFAGSVGVHAALIALAAFSGYLKFTKSTWGSEKVSTGSVGISIVKTIPIPQKEAPENPLANDTDAVTPQAPAPLKTKAQVQAPEPKAIAIPDKIQRKVSPKQQSAAVYRPKAEVYRPNQVYSQAPQAASSPMYGIQGKSGIDMGAASVLGDKCGTYADLMRDKIAGKWNRADVNATPSQKAGVTFTIAKNGAVSGVKLSHPSGNSLLDLSAQRALYDSNPLPPLTAPCDRNEATVELWFQLQH
jgi:outer membrane biosynthesis protein TonB